MDEPGIRTSQQDEVDTKNLLHTIPRNLVGLVEEVDEGGRYRVFIA